MTIKKLQDLAKKYETHSFIEDDPSQFLYKFPTQEDTEVLAFIAAMLSFGKREQFIKKINYICSLTNNSPSLWIKNKIYLQNFIPETESPTSAFYRFYTFQDMTIFFQEFSEILKKNSTFGEFLKSTYEKDTNQFLDHLISEAFPKSKVVAKGKTSANKRIHMFLRWMVRQNSPVDKGYWTWYPSDKLIIPLDTHVLQQSKKLGLIPESASSTRKTALEITQVLASIFPKDPVKGDYALFGLGIESTKKKI